ncbi:unnamed protein product [Calypogeia fissa]
MERERRDRHGEPSSSRDAKAALLAKIAEKRAGKNIQSTIEIAHAAPLPDSDGSGSETEEFYTPELKQPAAVRQSATVSSVRAAVEPDGDPFSSVLDSFGGLSLGGSFKGSNSRLKCTHSSPQVAAASVTEPVTEKSRNGNGYQPFQGGYAQEPVELSSDEEEEFQPVVPRRQKAKHPVDTEDQSSQRVNSPKTTNSEKEENGDSLKDGLEGDLVLVEGSKKYVLAFKVAHKLYSHQVSGLRWLWGLHLKKMGGILGDDMGLGKTMQTAAFFAGLFQSKLIKTAMVVAPKTLISHWIKELGNVGLSRKTHSFIDVSSRAREQALVKVLQAGGVLLTTYDMVRCNLQVLSGDKHGRDGYGDTSEDITTWDYLVLDEGHLIKNPSTGRAKSLRELPSSHRIIISGTPIQNNLKEMWALMDFCCPGLLGDKKEFKDKYEKQIVAGNDKHASDRMKRLGAAVAQELRQKMAPFFLRRMKSEVFPEEAESADAPKLSKKNDFIVWLKLTSRQEQLYRAFLESEAVFSALESSKALTALSVLKKICDHPSLLTKRAADDIAEGMEGMMGNEDRLEAERMTASLAGLVDDEADYENNGGAASCKIVFLLILLEKLLEEGHRTLIFSQTRKMLNIIQGELEHRKWDYCRIDGTYKSSERELAVENFQSDPDIPFFLLTSQVGGLGLTLTAADRVVIIDPAWNPSTDNQSVDRAYRIGQKKDVAVYRLMTCGTIEEKIYRKQVFKGGLMKIATETKNQMRYFSQQELHDLFRVPEAGFSVSTTQKQLAEEHFGEHQTSSDLEEHITYLEGLSMIAGVSHHDLLYSKAAPPLPPAVDDEADTEVSWEPRNPMYNQRQSKPASKVEETYTWDEANAAGPRSSTHGDVDIYDEEKHAYLRVAYYKDKIRRLAETLENEEVFSKLPDGGSKIIKKIKECNETMETFKAKAALYEKRMSSSSGDMPKRIEASNNNGAQPQFFDLDSPPEARAAAMISGQQPAVRVRSSSGNNIYNTRIGNEVRKSQGQLPPPKSASQSGLQNLEDSLNSLRV